MPKKVIKILFVKIENNGYGLEVQGKLVKSGQLDETITLIKEYKNAVNNSYEFMNDDRMQSLTMAIN